MVWSIEKTYFALPSSRQKICCTEGLGTLVCKSNTVQEKILHVLSGCFCCVPYLFPACYVIVSVLFSVNFCYDLCFSFYSFCERNNTEVASRT